jgi:hypothetical protein
MYKDKHRYRQTDTGAKVYMMKIDQREAIEYGHLYGGEDSGALRGLEGCTDERPAARADNHQYRLLQPALTPSQQRVIHRLLVRRVLDRVAFEHLVRRRLEVVHQRLQRRLPRDGSPARYEKWSSTWRKS